MCPQINPDFSEVVEITPGEYPARITGSEVKMTQKQEPMAQWELTLFGATDERVNGRSLRHRTMCVGRGAGMLKQLIKAATGEDLAPGQTFDTEALHGREVLLVVGKGKDRNGNETDFPEVKSVKPYRG